MAYVRVCTYAVLTNQSTATAYVTVCTSRGVRTLFDQSARDYGIRHGVYVTGCTSRGVRTLFNQSEHDYGIRHGVYVTGCTSRGVRTLFDQSARDILAY